MKPKEANLLAEILKDCEITTCLTSWENAFIDDMRARFTQYGERTHVSDRQWGILNRIEKKIYA